MDISLLTSNITKPTLSSLICDNNNNYTFIISDGWKSYYSIPASQINEKGIMDRLIVQKKPMENFLEWAGKHLQIQNLKEIHDNKDVKFEARVMYGRGFLAGMYYIETI